MMFDKPLVVFDIETIPDPDIGRSVYALGGTDAEVITAMVEKRRIDTSGRTDYPQSPFHKVACVCATIVRDSRVEIRSFAGEDERANIEGFYRLVAELGPRLVSWNGEGFDVPVLRYRAMRRGIQAAGFYDVPHVDVMQELSSHGSTAHAGLANVARTLGLPGKSFLEKTVWEHWLAGESGQVIEYCKVDTVLTLLVFATHAFHVAMIDRPALDSLVASARAAMSREPFEGWRALEGALIDWPHF